MSRGAVSGVSTAEEHSARARDLEQLVNILHRMRLWPCLHETAQKANGECQSYGPGEWCESGTRCKPNKDTNEPDVCGGAEFFCQGDGKRKACEDDRCRRRSAMPFRAVYTMLMLNVTYCAQHIYLA